MKKVLKMRNTIVKVKKMVTVLNDEKHIPETTKK